MEKMKIAPIPPSKHVGRNLALREMEYLRFILEQTHKFKLAQYQIFVTIYSKKKQEKKISYSIIVIVTMKTRKFKVAVTVSWQL